MVEHNLPKVGVEGSSPFARSSNMSYCIVSFAGDLPDVVGGALSRHSLVKIVGIGDYRGARYCDARFGIGQIGHLLGYLKKEGIKKIFLLGALRRPKLQDIKCDLTGFLWLWRMRKAFSDGDDALLTKIAELFAQSGVEVCSILGVPILREGLFFGHSDRTNNFPTRRQIWDIEKGVSVLRLLSHMDIGQSVVVQRGLVMGIETIEGTASLLARVKSVLYSGEPGVLVKMPKLNQNMAVDVPTIGLETVEQVKEAGLGGIALDFSGCAVVNKDLVLKKLNEYNMFLYDINA